MMKRLICVVLGISLIGMAASLSAADKPNIIFILADDK